MKQDTESMHAAEEKGIFAQRAFMSNGRALRESKNVDVRAILPYDLLLELMRVSQTNT